MVKSVLPKRKECPNLRKLPTSFPRHARVFGDASVFRVLSRQTEAFGCLKSMPGSAGGYPICDAAGGTFARWLLMDAMGKTPDYHDDWKEGVRMLRYDAAVFTHDNL